MNWLDILITVLVTIPAFFGYRKGFLRKFFGLLGLLVGFFLAVRFYGNLFDVLSKLVKSDPMLVKVLSFLIIIGAIYGAGVWLATFMSGVNSGTKMLDKISGSVMGFIQGVVVTSVLLVNLSSLDMPEQHTRDTSLLYASVYKVAPAIFDRIIEITPGIKTTYEEYKQLLLKK